MIVLVAFGAWADETTVRARTLSDHDGGSQHTHDWKKQRVVVLIFLGTECPVSNHYAPTIADLYKRFAGKDVLFLGVHADPDVDAVAAKKHAAEYRLPMLTLLDGKQELARDLGVRVVPQAVVLNGRGEICYQGRIDDRYAANGRRRDEPTTHDLRVAIEAVLRGEMPAVRKTIGFGCPLPSVKPRELP